MASHQAQCGETKTGDPFTITTPSFDVGVSSSPAAPRRRTAAITSSRFLTGLLLGFLTFRSLHLRCHRRFFFRVGLWAV